MPLGARVICSHQPGVLPLAPGNGGVTAIWGQVLAHVVGFLRVDVSGSAGVSYNTHWQSEDHDRPGNKIWE